MVRRRPWHVVLLIVGGYFIASSVLSLAGGISTCEEALFLETLD